MEITLFYITAGTQEMAASLANKALDQQLAGCANIFPIQSIYPWKNEMQNEGEFVLILKTVPSHAEQLREFILTNHPYEIPCIMNFNVEVNETYAKWIKDNIGEASE